MKLDKLTALADQVRARVARPVAAGPWFRISNAAAERAEVFIYGAIGSDWDPEDVTAAAFVQQLRGITAKSIDLHINSPGGLVFDGIAIHAALRNHPAAVTAYVDGIAASAASFVAMAADEVVIEKPAKMMIHDAGGLVIGNAADMREMADLLDDLSDTIAEMYADRAGGSVASWRAAMQATTWYGSAEAVKVGLADRVANDTAAGADPDDKPAKPGEPDAGRKTDDPDDRASQLVRARARVALRG